MCMAGAEHKMGDTDGMRSADAFSGFRGHCRIVQPQNRLCGQEAWCGVGSVRDIKLKQQPWFSASQLLTRKEPLTGWVIEILPSLNTKEKPHNLCTIHKLERAGCWLSVIAGVVRMFSFCSSICTQSV